MECAQKIYIASISLYVPWFHALNFLFQSHESLSKEQGEMCRVYYAVFVLVGYTL